jgi:hypothetical protein
MDPLSLLSSLIIFGTMTMKITSLLFGSFEVATVGQGATVGQITQCQVFILSWMRGLQRHWWALFCLLYRTDPSGSEHRLSSVLLKDHPSHSLEFFQNPVAFNP